MNQRRGIRPKLMLMVIVAGAIAAAIWWQVRPKEQEGDGPAAAGDRATAEQALGGLYRGQEAIPVRVTPTVLGTLVQTVHAEGRAHPMRQVRLLAQVSGAIERVQVQEGHRVRQGEVLIELADQEYRLELDSAQAALLRARADYAATQDQADIVAQSGLTPPSAPEAEVRLQAAERRFEQARLDREAGRIDAEEFGDIELEYQIARILAGRERGNIRRAMLIQHEVSVSRAERNLERTRVRAPFEGFVADLKVVPGQYLGSGTELLTLLDLSRVRIEVDVLESEIAPLRPGRKAEVRFTALSGEVFEALLTSINPMINPATRTGRVTLEMPNPGGRVTPGMFARARIHARDHHDVFMVPLEAIVERDERTLVFGLEPSADPERPDIVKWRYVQLGPRNDTHVIVHPTDNPHEGVREGMRVCIEGHITLQHDSPVRVVEEVPPTVITP